MRVPNLSTYSYATYNLGRITGDLQDANEVMSTQKRINRISDDPIGVSHVLDLETSLGNLEQVEKNVNMGISWLSGAENALGSVNDLILDAKTQVSRLVNASMSADERRDAIASIDGIIDQILTLGNVQINGNYIFGGTDTDMAPLEYHEASDPPWVEYRGNATAFEIKTDENASVEVGRVGATTLWEDAVAINSTNNTIVFKQDNGHGSASEKILTATIEEGQYSADELETAVKNALNDVSATDGYGVVYAVEYDEDEQQFSIREDGSYDGYIRTEFMWETGAQAYINQISASSDINPDDIHLSVENSEALTIDTPEPHGTEPLRVTWQGDGTWAVDNNPGYVIIPSTLPGSADTIGIDLDESGTADIVITLDTPAQQGQFIEFDIVSARGDHSVGHEIGFNGDNSIYAPPTADTAPVFVTDLTIGAGNDTIEFVETNAAGVTSATLSADIANAAYTDMDDLAAAVEAAMEAESGANGNSIDYAVSYDALESRFNIGQAGSALDELQILWSSSTAGASLGFYENDRTGMSISDERIVNITIDAAHNKLDFSEILKGREGKDADQLTAIIEEKTYTSTSQLALEVEKAMEDASFQNGNRIDYSVTWDDVTQKFTIKENGSALSGFDLLWQTGENAPVSAGGTGQSIGEILGFEAADDRAAAVQSDRKVEWGIFNTLVDLRQYLTDDDTDGIERTLGRLEMDFDAMSSEIVDIGISYNRLQIRQQINAEVNLSLADRKSSIEDVDIIEATLNLQSIQTAYQAALSSTATIMNISLVDYL